MKIRLQGVGWREAKPVNELKVGDTIFWNFGAYSTVLKLVPSRTGKSITAVLKESDSGNVVERRMGSHRLVAFE